MNERFLLLAKTSADANRTRNTVTDFARYCQSVLDAVMFEPRFEVEDEQVFAASLANFRQHATAWGGLRNDAGMTLDLAAGYVERMTPNASADHHEGRHMIVMHQALMATIIDLALYLFTQFDLFPDVGNAQDELSPIFGGEDAPGLFLLRMTMNDGAVDPAVDHVRVPRCADRHIAAIYIAILMGRFVWLHELAHCANGHVLFLKQGAPATRLNEVADPLPLIGLPSPAQREAARALRHAMEFDADRTALGWLMQLHEDGIENVPGLLGYPLAMRDRMALLGAFLMTWLFDEYQRFMDAQHGVTHPSPRARLEALARWSADHFDAVLVDDVRAMFNRLEDRIPGLSRLEATIAPEYLILPPEVTRWAFR